MRRLNLFYVLVSSSLGVSARGAVVHSRRASGVPGWREGRGLRGQLLLLCLCGVVLFRTWCVRARTRMKKCIASLSRFARPAEVEGAADRIPVKVPPGGFVLLVMML